MSVMLIILIFLGIPSIIIISYIINIILSDDDKYPIKYKIKLMIMKHRVENLINKSRNVKESGNKELTILSNIGHLDDLVQVRKEVLDQEVESNKLKIKEVLDNFINSLPIFIAMDKTSSIKGLDKIIEAKLGIPVLFIEPSQLDNFLMEINKIDRGNFILGRYTDLKIKVYNFSYLNFSYESVELLDGDVSDDK